MFAFVAEPRVPDAKVKKKKLGNETREEPPPHTHTQKKNSKKENLIFTNVQSLEPTKRPNRRKYANQYANQQANQYANQSPYFVLSLSFFFKGWGAIFCLDANRNKIKKKTSRSETRRHANK